MGNRRSRARQYALQALYQWQMTGQDVAVVERQFLEDEELAKADVGLFVALLRGIPTSLGRLDGALGPLLDRPMEQVDPVERAVLRIGAYELMEHPEIPYRVVINEAVELAKLFGAEQGHRYVNGVLDRLARQLRSGETGAQPPRRP
jgi:transcription antitermination protein NusB